MAYTFSNLQSDVRAKAFPEGEASNLVTPHNTAILDALIDLQQWVDCLQQNNTTIVPACNTFYNCGLTAFDAPRGAIKKVSVIDTLPEGSPGGTVVISESFDADITVPLPQPAIIGSITTGGSYVLGFNIQNPDCPAPPAAGAPPSVFFKPPAYAKGGAQYFNVTVIYTDATTNKQVFSSQLLPLAACNETLYANVNIAAGTDVFCVIIPVNTPPTTGTASITISVMQPAPYQSPEVDEWCSEIEYTQTDPHYVQNYFLHRGRRRDCTLGGFFALPFHDWELVPRPRPARDIGLPPGLAPLPLGYHYNQADTDKRRRSRGGLWAIERQNIYIIPWIQSTEKVVVKWDGIKRTWGASDPVDQDPLLIKAVVEWVLGDHYQYYDRQPDLADGAKRNFTETRQTLIHQCHEESRIRKKGEVSLARAQSTVLSLFYNSVPQTATANCPAGQTGSATTATVSVGTVSSTLSVADANQQALIQAQANAAAQLNCQAALPTFLNTPQSYTATCTTTDPNAPTPSGNSVTVNIPAGAYTSNVSQADANQQALAAAQQQAASQLVCTWQNSPQTYTATCPTGETGSPSVVTIAAGQYTSAISQADANQQALTAATNQANAALVCNGQGAPVYYNTSQNVCITRNAVCRSNSGSDGGGGGQFGPGSQLGQVQVCVTVPPNTASSTVSVATANTQAYQLGLNFAQTVAIPESTPCNSTLNLTY